MRVNGVALTYVLTPGLQAKVDAGERSLDAMLKVNLLVIDPPAFDAEEFCNLTITVAPTPLGRPYQSQAKSIIITPSRLVLQGASRQTDHPACPRLGRCELVTRMDNGLT